MMLHLAFNIPLFSGNAFVLVGAVSLVFGTFLIIWAQHTSRHLNVEHVSKENFCKGPYCYTRGPTHWGLFFLLLGFGLVINSLFATLFSIIALVLTRMTFLRKEEEALAEKYGTPYLEYKKIVKF